MSVYDDMSVEACAKRYEEERRRIVEAIGSGRMLGGSLSPIEYYPKDRFHDLTDSVIICANLTWDGAKHIDRPLWEEEFAVYRSRQQGEE